MRGDASGGNRMHSKVRCGERRGEEVKLVFLVSETHFHNRDVQVRYNTYGRGRERRESIQQPTFLKASWEWNKSRIPGGGWRQANWDRILFQFHCTLCRECQRWFLSSYLGPSAAGSHG